MKRMTCLFSMLIVLAVLAAGAFACASAGPTPTASAPSAAAVTPKSATGTPAPAPSAAAVTPKPATGTAAPAPSAAAVTPKPATATAAPAVSTFDQQWKDLIAAAKKEGEVTVYTQLPPETRTALSNAFRQQFGVDMSFIVGQPAEIAARMETERNANLYAVDAIVHGGVAMFAFMKPKGFLTVLPPLLINPEVLDGKAWRGGKLPYLDKEQQVVLFAYPYFPDVVVNTDMVKKGQLNSWQDLLKPEWKEKIVMGDPTVSGVGNAWAVFMLTKQWTRDKAEQYLRDFVKQQPIINRDDRLQAEWIARGRYPVLVGSDPQVALPMKQAGAPIDFGRMSEGGRISTGPGAVAIPNKVPHPNAAKLFVNWLLTKDAQVVFARAYGQPSARVDVSLEGMDPGLLPAPGETVHILDEDFWLSVPKLTPLVGEIFAPALK